MNLATKVTGTVLLSAGLLFSTNTAHARFLSIDPVNFDPNAPATFNRYSYVENNPINATDPFGLEKREIERKLPAVTGTRIGKTASITVEAGDLTQENLDGYFSDLPDTFFQQYDGSDFSGNSTDVRQMSSAGETSSGKAYEGSNNFRDVINVAQQIGRGVYGNKYDSSIAVFYRPGNGNLAVTTGPRQYTVRENGVRAGAQSLINSSIHERFHIYNDDYGRTYTPNHHQSILNNVNSLLMPLGFDRDNKCMVGASNC